MRDDAARALLTMQGEGLPRPRPAGVLDAMDKGALVPSRAAEHAQYVAGLSGDLERTLEGIDGVLSARVHLNVPDPDPLQENPNAASARPGVLLEHRGTTPPIAVSRRPADRGRGRLFARAGLGRGHHAVPRSAAAGTEGLPLAHVGPIAVARTSMRGATTRAHCGADGARRDSGRLRDPGALRAPRPHPRRLRVEAHVIAVRGLSKAFPTAGARTHDVLRDVTTSKSPEGAWHGLIPGPGAAGKSVLLKMLTGLLHPDRGTVTIAGEEVTALSDLRLQEFRKQIGMLFQNSTLCSDHLSVADNIAFPSAASLRAPPKTKYGRGSPSASPASNLPGFEAADALRALGRGRRRESVSPARPSRARRSSCTTSRPPGSTRSRRRRSSSSCAPSNARRKPPS